MHLIRSAAARCLRQGQRRPFCALSSLKTPVYEQVPWPLGASAVSSALGGAQSGGEVNASGPGGTSTSTDTLLEKLKSMKAAGKGLDTPIDFTQKDGVKPLVQPEMRFSVLENGMRIVSIDKHGLTSNIGLFAHVGSRFEGNDSIGLSHMMELLAFRAYGDMSHLRIARSLERLGATAGCVSDREHLVYQVEEMLVTSKVLKSQ